MNLRPNKKMMWKKYIGMAIMFIAGGMCGVWIAKIMTQYVSSLSERLLGQKLLSLAVLLVGMYLAVFLSVIVHEAGHLVFGHFSGYQFSSFRIGKWMWIKENGKLCFRKLSIAGTGGQCLMNPPEMTDGTMPVVLYNLGGSIMNAIVSLLCVGLYFLTRTIPCLPLFFIIMAIIGAVDACSNAIPMKLGMVNNDGHNAFSLRKDKEAQRAFWVQLRANNELARGKGIAEQPAEWFAMPSDEGLKNSMTAVLGVFACNRLVEERRFEEAAASIEELLSKETAIVDLHRNLLICDLIYCELIGENRQERLAEMMDKEQIKFMKTMKSYPAVLRTQYAYALLNKKDVREAEKIRTQFEKVALTYPYPRDVESEREFMEIARRTAGND